MTTVIVIVSLLTIYWFLAYREAALQWWVITTTFVVAILIAGQLLSPAAVAVISIGALLFLILWGAKPVRLRLISAPLLHQFRKVLPPLSTTEQQALDAGTVWWDGELFSGKPDWQQLLSIPPATLSSEEQAFMDGPLETLCNIINDWKITHEDNDLSIDIWDYIKQQRFFGIIIPKAYGGLEFSAFAHSQIVMKLASRSITAAVTVMVPNSLGPGKLLLHYGTKAQKQRYLPKLATGEEIPCFALTGPKAGSDAGAIPDTGVVCHDTWNGKQTLGVRLNWEKRYITLGPISTIIGLAFKLYDPDHILSEQESRGITVALIPSETSGVEIGERHIPLDIPFQNGPNRGHDVFVPLEQIIGGEDGIGQGWKMLVESLAEGRGISLPSLATGAAKSAARYSGAYARIRRQFNLPIGKFEGIQEALARIAGYTYQADAARKLTLSGIDLGEKPSVVTAIVKYHLTERYRRITNDAMDIQGGSGICLGPSNLTGRAYQAIPISITVEGANILTRSMIIFGQGAIRSHPWVLKEFQAVVEEDQEKALKSFDHALLGHAGYMVANIARSLLLGVTRGRLSKIPPEATVERIYYQRLNWMSAAFALCADASMMTLGGELKRKERLSARLGDLLSELYLSSAVLKRFHDEGRQEDDLPLLHWAMQQSLYNMQQSLHALLRNLPLRPLAWILRLLVFPTGSPFHEADDHLDSKVAKLLLQPSAARDRLTDGIFITTDTDEPVGQLEVALDLCVQLDAVEKSIHSAHKKGDLQGATAEEIFQSAHTEGLVDDQQLDQLLLLEELRNKVIAVDSFEKF